jgi:hypothetical protein
MSPEELRHVAPLLLGSGAAALGWRHIRDSALSATRAGQNLRQAYRFHVIWARLHERMIIQMLGLLRGVGVEPLLGKGWAAARLYPDVGLRPYGDIDIFVRPQDHEAAERALAAPGVSKGPVDLQPGLRDLDDRSMDTVLRHSQLVPIGESQVRVLGDEDQLRFACLHLLRHGAWRPLWLCDTGVMLDGMTSDFDWGYFLSGDRTRSAWVMCVLAVARRLLGADFGGNSTYTAKVEPPRWLVPAVVREWGRERYPERQLVDYLRSPKLLPGAVKRRWPGPIQASFPRHSPSERLPVMGWQLGAFLRRAGRFGLRVGFGRPP